MTHPDLSPGDRVHHRGRDQDGTYKGSDEADPSGATVWVEFNNGDLVMVSRHLLTERRQPRERHQASR